MAYSKYRWKEWFRKRQFILRRGLDYKCPPSTMAQQIRNAAVKFGVKVSIVEADNGAGFIVAVREPLPPEGQHEGKGEQSCLTE